MDEKLRMLIADYEDLSAHKSQNSDNIFQDASMDHEELPLVITPVKIEPKVDEVATESTVSVVDVPTVA